MTAIRYQKTVKIAEDTHAALKDLRHDFRVDTINDVIACLIAHRKERATAT